MAYGGEYGKGKAPPFRRGESRRAAVDASGVGAAEDEDEDEEEDEEDGARCAAATRGTGADAAEAFMAASSAYCILV